jgi:hypothetical protein
MVATEEWFFSSYRLIMGVFILFLIGFGSGLCFVKGSTELQQALYLWFLSPWYGSEARRDTQNVKPHRYPLRSFLYAVQYNQSVQVFLFGYVRCRIQSELGTCRGLYPQAWADSARIHSVSVKNPDFSFFSAVSTVP